ncbi:hypothetical protein NHX12_023342 [Muraenolepis orangiensis]|uniref:Polypeptide N-acetylgalactosaminyltransferase n=1 Tax=Muraenolepis orangiensis TaxID=630683 RepID=A0A9Q0EJ43_9TELE|nr:hypothetical protein NHX12_023342 [Muraenolepis orangiensis]
MMAFWRRNQSKSTWCLFGTFFVGYVLFMRNSSDGGSSTNGRRAAPPGGPPAAPGPPPGDQAAVPDDQPVYPKPPLDAGGLGEMGKAVRLDLHGEEQKKEQEGIDKHQINTYVSDRISLHRRLPDIWNPLCKDQKYDYRSLPTTSVVIAFYNEAWSTLLRTVHSVLETSPDILLTEIILVDDFSDQEHLKAPLEAYLSAWRKVRLIRATKREGLVRARLLGASISTGQVLTFLDCHCECHSGWLEPLLHRIKEAPSAVVCPVIDVINWNTFEYLGNPREPQIGGFDWRLVFTWHSVPPYEQKHRRSPVDVIRSPTMAGGLFSISTRYFLHLGTYDTGMEIWQCGGSLEVHPCSHVGHVFPKRAPYSRSKALSNSIRAAEVWMDGYKDVYYHRNPHARLDQDVEPFGDVTDRLRLRSQLGCKSFQWYLENIYPDLTVPEDRPGMFGMLKNRGKTNFCFDYNPVNEEVIAGQRIILYSCHGMGQNQFFELSSLGEIQFNTRFPAGCATGDNISTYLVLQLCRTRLKPVIPDQKFHLREDGTLFHESSGKCVEAVDATDNGTPAPALRPCSDSAHQRWFFEEKIPS